MQRAPRALGELIRTEPMVERTIDAFGRSLHL